MWTGNPIEPKIAASSGTAIIIDKETTNTISVRTEETFTPSREAFAQVIIWAQGLQDVAITPSEYKRIMVETGSNGSW